MATELGKAYIEIVPSANGLSGQIASVMDADATEAGASAGEAFSGSFGSMLQSTLSSTLGIITEVTNALVGSVMETSQLADNIDKTSQQFGISAEFFQEWDAVLQHSGTSMNSMSATFRRLATASQSASADQVAAFERLGLSMEEVSQMSTEDLFENVIYGLQEMEAGTERTALATQLLGRGSQELGALFNTSAEDTQAMIDRVHELGGVMSDTAIKDGAAFQDSIQDLETAFNGLKNNTMAELLPAFTQISDGLTELFIGNSSKGLGAITGGFNQISTKIASATPQLIQVAGTLISSLSEAFIMNAPLIIESFASIVSSLTTVLSENSDSLVDGVISLLDTFVSLIIENAPLLLEGGIALIIGLAEGLSENIDTIIPEIVVLVGNLAQILVDNAPLLITAGLDLIMAIGDGLLQSIPILISMLPELITGILNGLYESTTEIIQAGIELFSALVEDLPAIIDVIVEVLPDLIVGITTALLENAPDIMAAGIDLFVALVSDMPGILSALGTGIIDLVKGIIAKFVENYPDMKEAGVDLFKQLGEKISDAIEILKEKAGEIIEGIKTALEDGWQTIKDVGSFLIEGLWDGIDDKVDWIVEQVKGFGNDVLDAIKGIFDINSPSKEFYKIGQFCVEGFNEPFENFGDKAISEVQDTVDRLGHIDSDNWIPSINATMETSYNANPYRTNDLYLLMDMLDRYLTTIISNQGNVTTQTSGDRLFDFIVEKNNDFRTRTGVEAI